MVALPPGYEAQVRPALRPRCKHGVTVLNSPGNDDADYRGEINVILIIKQRAVPYPPRRAHRADGDCAGDAGAAWFPVASLSEPGAAAAVWLDRPLKRGGFQEVPVGSRLRTGSLRSCRPIKVPIYLVNIIRVKLIRISSQRDSRPTVWTLLADSPWDYSLSIRAERDQQTWVWVCVRSRSKYRQAHDLIRADRTILANHPEGLAGLESCVLGQIMLGVVAAMRRTLLSCTHWRATALVALATTTLPRRIGPGRRADIPQAVSAWLELDHQDSRC